MAVPQNSTVRWFTSDMAGAPILDETPGAIIAILDACLINGFGTATPDGNKITISGGVATVEFSGGNTFEKYAVIEIEGATPSELNDVWRITATTATTFSFYCPGIPDGNATGSITVKRATPGYWEKAFGDNLKAAYRSTHPDSYGCFIRVDDSAPYNDTFRVPVRCYQGMTDIDTGTNEFPTFADQPTDNSSANHQWTRIGSPSYAPANWALIADERFFYFMPSYYYNRGAALYEFGDIVGAAPLDIFACLTSADIRQSTYPGQNCKAFETRDNFTAGYYFAASKDGLTRGPGASKAGIYGQNNLGNTDQYGSTDTYPASVSGGYLFFPVIITQAKSMRGRAPGLLQTITKLTSESRVPVNGVAKLIDKAHVDDNALLMVQLNFGTTSVNDSAVGVFDIEGPWR